MAGRLGSPPGGQSPLKATHGVADPALSTAPRMVVDGYGTAGAAHTRAISLAFAPRKAESE